LAVAAGLIMFVVASLAGVAGQTGYLALTGGGLQGAAQNQAAAPGAMLIFLVVMQATLVLLVVVASRLFGDRPGDVLALGAPPQGRRAYALGLAGLLGIVGVLDIGAIVLSPEPLLRDIKPFVGLINSRLWWLTLVVVGIGAPLSEELLFRGFLMSALARTRLGFVGASLLTTASWTALHAGYSAFGMFEVATIGLYLSWLLWRTGSLRVTMFCHGVYNALMTLLIGVLPLPG
jgi:membrane protease YdiL (CAAX protease family)